MKISTIGPNCFKAREITQGSGEIMRMLRMMQDHGVKFQIIHDRSSEIEFCIL